MKMKWIRLVSLITILLFALVVVNLAFPVGRLWPYRRGAQVFFSSPPTSSSGDDEKKKSEDSNKRQRGYKFGDFTRFLTKKATGRVNQLTGKTEYQFGDLTQWMDQQAKTRVSELTGKDGEYEFGDLTRWADSVAKQKVSNFTKKEGYEVGDISREIVRRIWAGEIELADAFLALRILVSVGASMTPVASVLPVRWLFELINFGLAQDIGGRLLGVLAVSLDERMKEVLVGDAKYQLGDLTKRKLRDALSDFTGKDGEYEFGDISRRITELADERGRLSSGSNSKLDPDLKLTEDAIAKELDDWDRKFHREQEERSLGDSMKKDK